MKKIHLVFLCLFLVMIGATGIFLFTHHRMFHFLLDRSLVYKAEVGLICQTFSLFLIISGSLSILWLIIFRHRVSIERYLESFLKREPFLTRLRAILFVSLLFLAFLIYLPSFQIGFHSDDYAWLVDSARSSKDLSHLFSLSQSHFFRPVTHLYHLVNYLLFEENPTFYHFSGVLLHGINSFLLFLIAARITQRTGMALLSSLLFCTYPAFSRSVLWISGGEITFAAFLYLSSFYLFLIFTEDRRSIYHLASVGLFLLGLLSKEAVITLGPTALLVWLYIRQERRVFWGAVVLMSLASIDLGVQLILQSKSVLVKQGTYGIHLSVMVKNFTGYLLSSGVPYSHRLIDLWPSLRNPVLLLEIGFWVVLWSKGKRAIRFLLFWSLLLLSPYLLFNLPVQTRYLYLPMLAFSMLSACVLSDLYTKFFSDSEIKKLLFHILMIFAVIGNIFLIRIEASVMRTESKEMKTFIETVRRDSRKMDDIRKGKIPENAPMTSDHLKAALGL